ncbi:MAG TPA: AbrB family transcriptional regulator [Roseiarcus sp.]|nr:AbrB family transcriptional regulator [Roseiarcus sp.]
MAAASAAFVAALAAALCAAATSALIGVSFVQALVAFAPGGLEAMTMMAFALGLDPLFVGAHHLARSLLISLTLPFAARVMNESQGDGR